MNISVTKCYTSTYRQFIYNANLLSRRSTLCLMASNFSFKRAELELKLVTFCTVKDLKND